VLSDKSFGVGSDEKRKSLPFKKDFELQKVIEMEKEQESV